MNKKLNTFLFIIAATLGNILIAVICFMILLLLFIKLIAPHMPKEAASWTLALIFVIAVSLSFLIYQKLIKFFIAHVKMEDYFDPIFASRYKKPPKKKE